MILELRDVSVSFQRYRGWWRREETQLLQDITFTLRRGQMLAVIGSSGAGKSLLAHAILDLLPATATRRGEILFAPGLGPRSAAFLPQEISYLDPSAKLGAQIAWAARRGGKATQVEGDLNDLGLSPSAARLYPHQLSGGMARRGLMAMAKAQAPQVIVADEPTHGLDPQNTILMLRALRAHADQGGAVVMITHDLAASLPFADQVAVLEGGHMRSLQSARVFTPENGGGACVFARRLWASLPENGFHADA